MSKTIKVDLPDPVETHSGLVTKVEFREPTSRDFFSLGEPFQIIDQSGSGFLVEKDEVILSYMERCVQQPFDPVLLGTMSLANGMICRERFLSFFAQARAKMLSTLATFSSST